MNKNNFTLWLTGLSASGKTTLARELYQKLSSLNLPVHHLDGDEVRAVSQEDLGFDAAGRDKNIRLAIALAKKYQDQGLIVIASFISPYRHHRDWARAGLKNYIEVFVDTPLSLCEARDPKGLYKKARLGEIKKFTGLDDPYENPENPDIHIRGGEKTLAKNTEQVIEYLKNIF